MKPKTIKPRAVKTVTEFNTNWALAYPALYQKSLGDLLADAIFLRRRIRIEYAGPNRYSVYVIVWDDEHTDGDLEL